MDGKARNGISEKTSSLDTGGSINSRAKKYNRGSHGEKRV
jgi:hypothetical protein